MEKEKTYNQTVDGDEGFTAGDGYPSCEGQPCDNMAESDTADTDTLADREQSAATDEKSAGAEAATGETDEAAAAAEALAEAQNEVAVWKDKHLRLQAEFDNYRKRTLKEKMDLVQSGGKDVLTAILPVVDDLQRAVAAAAKTQDCEALKRGMELIEQKFIDILRQKGVTAIESKGRAFDPEEEEAVARFAAGEEMKGKVVDVIQTGYKLGDKVLRFAKVVVGE